jgi:hypothetical protein
MDDFGRWDVILRQLSGLRDSGATTPGDYEQARAKALA